MFILFVLMIAGYGCIVIIRSVIQPVTKHGDVYCDKRDLYSADIQPKAHTMATEIPQLIRVSGFRKENGPKSKITLQK
ncbi:MAG: hypothetical protein EBU46_14115 [Nitrosomonadaceae bacterium]|nr:hypothetical protein [Nitrosomonadaceae bacterium]